MHAPKGAKKPELLSLLHANLQLPACPNVPAIVEQSCHDVGLSEGDAGHPGHSSDVCADRLTVMTMSLRTLKVITYYRL